MIAIIDYGSGNVAAIANIYQQLRISHKVTADHDIIDTASHIVLAGVGSFDVTMNNLNTAGLTNLLKDQILVKRKAMLGICVGMQILAQSSEEGELRGLGFVDGCVKRIDTSMLDTALRLPHMGWNSICAKPDEELFQGVDTAKGFYFLHSYYFAEQNSSEMAASVNYGRRFTCAVRKRNVLGVQFHPEKSHSNGIEIFRNFASCSDREEI